MLLFLVVMGLLSENLCSSSLEADPGDNVTLWCQHELDHAGYIFWFYQDLSTAALSTTSVPALIGCRHFKMSSPAHVCYFYSGRERMVMSVQGKNTSLTITAVNVSDTGLYYCGFMQLNQISFSNSSYLRMKGGNETLPKSTDTTPVLLPGSDTSSVFFILNVAFSSATLILFCVLIFLTLMYRTTHKVDNPEATNTSNLVQTNRKPTVTQVTSCYNRGMQKCFSEHTIRRPLKQMDYSSRRSHQLRAERTGNGGYNSDGLH
ncbi:uncharacterized protein Hap1MRO34_023444 isoform 1-T1 [Clarias gariepinus]|uniref:uncharacterized protein LOC128509143 n=1 Tax=Clarias gariepinus TaxID=13013 RepID=UPI00234E2CCB|nr:uncharacterized protein LOC128509143 [Clarias gariepinus]